MRLPGTCSRYSNNAMPQLTSAATIQGLCPSSLRCAYQAKVMNTLLKDSSPTVISTLRMNGSLVRSSQCPARLAEVQWRDRHMCRQRLQVAQGPGEFALLLDAVHAGQLSQIAHRALQFLQAQSA